MTAPSAEHFSAHANHLRLVWLDRAADGYYSGPGAVFTAALYRRRVVLLDALYGLVRGDPAHGYTTWWPGVAATERVWFALDLDGVPAPLASRGRDIVPPYLPVLAAVMLARLAARLRDPDAGVDLRQLDLPLVVALQRFAEIGAAS